MGPLGGLPEWFQITSQTHQGTSELTPSAKMRNKLATDVLGKHVIPYEGIPADNGQPRVSGFFHYVARTCIGADCCILQQKQVHFKPHQTKTC